MMELTITQEEGRVPVTIFRIEGQINMGSHKILEDKARQELGAGMHYLLIDLSQVTSLTSAGLRTIHLINNLLSSNPPADATDVEEQELGGAKSISPYLKLLNPQPNISRVLSVSGFDSFIEVFDDQQAAVESF
jgi:anti-anti-sigma regulatory factor